MRRLWQLQTGGEARRRLFPALVVLEERPALTVSPSRGIAMRTEITTLVPAVLQAARPDALAMTVAFTKSLGGPFGVLIPIGSSVVPFWDYLIMGF